MNILLSIVIALVTGLILMPISALLSLIVVMPVTVLLNYFKTKKDITIRYVSRLVSALIYGVVFSFLTEYYSLNSFVMVGVFILIWIHLNSDLKNTQTNRFFLSSVLDDNIKRFNFHRFWILLFSLLAYYAGNFLMLAIYYGQI